MTDVDRRISDRNAVQRQVAMQGGGRYDRNCRPQASDVEAAATMLVEAAQAVSESRCGLPVRIVDYGCAEGRNSRRVTDILRQSLRQACHPWLSIVRNDLASNDFARVMKDAAHRGDQAEEIEAFEFVRPGSFYAPVLPPDSVDIACCFAALHWLSRIPQLDGLTRHISCEASPELNASFASQAENDWRTFLRRRADELAAGGRLVVSILGRHADDEDIHGPFELMQCAADQLVRQQAIAQETLNAFVFPVYRRTCEETLRPFEEMNSNLARQLVVQETRHESVSCPLMAAIRNDVEPAVAARRYVSFIRAFSEATIRTGLFTDDDDATRAGKLDHLYRVMERLAAAEPERFQLRRSRILLMIERLDRGHPPGVWPQGTRHQSAATGPLVGELSV